MSGGKCETRWGQCSVCGYRHAVRRDGMIRVHFTRGNGSPECPGSNRPPRDAPQPSPNEEKLREALYQELTGRYMPDHRLIAHLDAAEAALREETP